MIVVCRNLRFLNNFPEISSKRSTSWNKFINVNTWSNATSANTPDPLSLVTESQSLPLDLLMCIKVVRGFIWTWSRLNMKCSVGPCWVLGWARRGGAQGCKHNNYWLSSARRHLLLLCTQSSSLFFAHFLPEPLLSVIIGGFLSWVSV